MTVVPSRDVTRAAAGAAGTDLGALVTLHALGWLVAGSAVGLLLSTLLVWPELGAWLAPWSYGRWMPLHLDFLLWGWLAVPLLGVLLRLFLPAGGGWRGEAALASWSGCLLAGGVTWLAGRTSGKPFLEWTGGARTALAAGLGALVVLLADGWRARRRQAPGGPAAELGRGLLLALLAGIAPLVWLATDPGRYPAVDPASGGPTGTSLLGSTIALLAILLAAPRLAGVPPRDAPVARRRTVEAAVALAATAVLFLALPHGDRANAEPAQLAALIALAPWLLVLPRYALAFAWPRAARRWLAACAAWGALLLPTATLTFLPPVLRGWKFTNGLVAHAHLAMAGLCSSFAALLLVALARGGALEEVLAARRSFWLWQGGCALMLVALGSVGAAEARDPGLLFRPGEVVVGAGYAARWLAGAAMLAGAIGWWRTALARAGAEP